MSVTKYNLKWRVNLFLKLIKSLTVFEWGSCFKLLVWVAVMQLEEQRKPYWQYVYKIET